MLEMEHQSLSLATRGHGDTAGGAIGNWSDPTTHMPLETRHEEPLAAPPPPGVARPPPAAPKFLSCSISLRKLSLNGVTAPAPIHPLGY